ncbi:origin recognition complex, subunit 2, partial [Russula dissimulans]
TSFEAYFQHASRPSRTSSNVFSQLVQPLSADEYAASLSRSFYPLPFSPAANAHVAQLQHAHRAAHLLPRYLLELAEGFNLLFYGLGSKRAALNDLARATHAAGARAGAGAGATHVLVINGFLPSCSARDIGAALARLPGAPQGVQGNNKKEKEKNEKNESRRLVLVVHNMDAPALRAPKARSLLRALAALNGVQLAASVDHINAPLQWTSTELLAGRWLWHDLTTLAPYDVELATADPASLRGAPATAPATTTTAGAGAGAPSGVGGSGGAAGGQTMTETAARHVLAAVTQRARKLFMLIGRRQLDALAATSGSGIGGGGAGAVMVPTTPAEAGQVAISYDMLFNLARDHFVATNDTALRALLGEFKDHGLVVTVGTGAMGSGEMLWIPLRRERLTKLLDGLEQE